MDCVFTLRRLQHGHLFQFLNPALCFTTLGRVVAEFVNESLQMGALGHLIFVLALGGFSPFFFGGVELVEVGAFVVVEAFGVLVDYVGCDFIEEGAIVGDDEEGAGVGLEVGGEEGYGGHVQHVGGFWGLSAGFRTGTGKGDLVRGGLTVEQEEIWFAEQCSR